MRWPPFTLPWIHREPSGKWLFGVCAGISRITGIPRPMLRISAVALAVFFPVPTIGTYALLVVLTAYRESPGQSSAAAHDEDRTVAVELEQLQAAQRQYRALNDRLAELEAEITSQNAETKRQFDEALGPHRKTA